MELAGTPGAWRLAVPAFAARVPMGMETLLLILATTAHHGSYAAAGTLTAGYGIASAVGSPLRGRMSDQVGMRPVLVITGCGETLALLVFFAASVFDWPLAARLVPAVVMGLLFPPVGAIMRRLWRDLLAGSPVRDTAFALESLVTDLVYVLGPLVVTAALAFGSPDTGLLVAAALVLIGTLGLATAHPTSRPRTSDRADRDWLGAISAPEVRRLLPVVFCSFGALGAVDFGAIAAAKEHGAASAAGPLVAAMSIGSIIGAVYWGSRDQPGTLRAQFLLLSGVLVAGFLTLSVIPGLIALGVVLAVTGTAVAPVMTVEYTQIEHAAFQDHLTEAFAWLTGLSGAGGAAATVLAGEIVNHYRAGGAFLLAAAMTLLGAILATTLTAAPTTKATPETGTQAP
jgi:MFS family permease